MAKPDLGLDLGEDERLIAPLHTGRGFWILVSVLSAIGLWGLFAYTTQLARGLSVTGLNVPVYWGLYITHFVFFIGISHAGTLISAILRLAQAEWRRSITRSAEVITVLVLLFGVGCVLLDLGRPDRALNVLLHPHFTSPLLWDVTSITVYLTASTVYLYLPLIPDIAILRDHMPRRRWFYRVLALGWTGTERQQQLLNRAIAVMAVLVIPIAVSVHTVVSWVFGMTVQPMWHSTIFGPYFVVGAIFSGIAAIIIAMAVLRKAYRLEDYLKPIHFANLGILLLVMALLWFYFTFAEFLTTYYGAEPTHMTVFLSKTEGQFSHLFWTMVVACFVVPFLLLTNPRTRGTVWGTVAASCFVEVGMWLERYLIVVPSLAHPRLPMTAAPYAPTWVEWSLFAAFTAIFILLYAVFTKLFPIVSIWEIREGREHSVREVAERVAGYLPTTPALVLLLCLLPLGARAEFGDPMRGQSLFVSKGCVGCHAVRGAGGRVGPDLGRTAVKGSFYEIASAMWNHALVMDEKMREFRLARPSFQETELQDLLAFLYFLNYFDEPGDPKLGKVLFAEKHCIQCHSLGREGGVTGPRLDDLPRGTPPLRIAQGLWNHGPAMVPAIRRLGLAIPQFQGSEIVDLFAYLRSQGRRQAAREFRSAGNAARGRRLFADKGCARCHAVHGKTPDIGPDLGRNELRGSVTQLAGRMWNHWPAMSEAMGALGMAPPTFREDELADVFAYIFISRYEGQAGSRERGLAVYGQKGCAACHGEAGEGGIGPALQGRTTGETRELIVQRMWNHAPQMWSRMGTEGMAWPRFEGDELGALLSFLGGLERPAAAAAETETKR